MIEKINVEEGAINLYPQAIIKILISKLNELTDEVNDILSREEDEQERLNEWRNRQ